MKKFFTLLNNVMFYISLIVLSLSSLFLLFIGFFRFSVPENWGDGVTLNQIMTFMTFLVIQTGSLGVFVITRHFRNHFK